MLSTVRKWVLSTGRRFGLVINRSNYYSREDIRLLRFLEINQVDTILDVGANQGEYAAALLEGGFQGRIYSFEALPEMHEKLLKRAVSYPDRWIIAPRCAVSSEDGVAKFHVNKSAATSSLLAPSQKFDDASEILALQSVIEVPTRTIADLCDDLGISSNRIFLKLDVQGGEEKALIGAEKMLDRVSGMVVEMALREYYESQALWRTLDGWIVERGYEIWDIMAIWRSKSTGRLYHIDATYFRPNEQTE